MHFPTWKAKAMAMAIILLQLSFTFEVLNFPYLADLIVGLPGQPLVSFQQSLGYLTVDDKKHKSLSYYFVESETDPASRPLILWLNGGCSSVGVGALSENGPFRPNGQVLIKNEFSWNREANIFTLLHLAYSMLREVRTTVDIQ